MTTPVASDQRRAQQIIVAVWAALTTATIAAWLLTAGESGSSTALGDGLVAMIVVLGAVKCRLIIRYFMEVRHAPRWLQRTTDAWLAVLWLTLFITYLT